MDIPLASFVAEHPAEREQFVEHFRPLAEKYKSIVSVAVSDIDTISFAKTFGREPTEWPAFGIRDFRSGYRMSLGQGKELIEGEVTRVVDAFLAGNSELNPTGILYEHDEL